MKGIRIGNTRIFRESLDALQSSFARVIWPVEGGCAERSSWPLKLLQSRQETWDEEKRMKESFQVWDYHTGIWRTKK